EFRHVMEVVAGDIKNYADLPGVFGRLARYGYGGPFVLSIERHPLDARQRLPLFVVDDTFRNFSTPNLVTIFGRAQHLTGWDSRFQLDRVRRTLKVLRMLEESFSSIGGEDADWSYEEYVQSSL